MENQTAIESAHARKIEDLIKKGWTQGLISDVTAIPQSTLSKIARGVHPDPRASHADAIDKLHRRVMRGDSKRSAK